jgi:acetyl-CoA carboxylase carboxyl transferase subunit alpha
MAAYLLDFEKPIGEIENKIEELKTFNISGTINADEEIKNLELKRDKLINEIFKNLNSWQIAQLSRHPERPHTLDYIDIITDNFVEMHGDRAFMDDRAVVGGFGFIKKDNAASKLQRVLVVGHQKGRTTKDKMQRNFGMPNPEGYRKAQRLFKLAEKYLIPVITFIDTPGAYPGLGAEERGQSEAIARSIYTLLNIKVPVVAIIIGEGGSGGALAFGVADKVFMLEYSMYSVISPEGCASILYKDISKTEEAANALKLTSKDLFGMGIIDGIIQEPPGGAHRNKFYAAASLKNIILETINDLNNKTPDVIREERIKKWINIDRVNKG